MSDLTKDLKVATLEVLDQLIKHNVRGADLIRRGIVAFTEIEEHKEELLQIISLLQPIVIEMWERVKAWLAKAYAHLVELWEWACEVWRECFGSKTAV